MSSLNNRSTSVPAEHTMIAAMRIVLALSALLIIYLDPSEPDRLVPVTYAALVLYTLYSAALYICAAHYGIHLRWVRDWGHWLDVGCYLILIALSSGTSSIFFYFFFFAILTASFRWGFTTGLRVVIVSSVLFTIIGYVTAPPGEEFELNRSLLRPIYLLALGYMMAYWGGFEIMLKSRLALLKEVTLLSNPRFGIDRTIGSIIERVRAYYDANACLFIQVGQGSADYQLRRADRRDPEAGMRAEPLSAELAHRLLALPSAYSIIYSAGSRRPLRGGQYKVFDPKAGRRLVGERETLEIIATTLDTRSFITVPLYYHGEIIGRIYITSGRDVFNQSDVEFLLYVIEHVMPVLDNIRLVDRLASDAAEEERQRIARDIHDSAIQPYIGLQIGLAAVSQKLATGHPDVSGDINRLYEMTGMGIADLRRYVRGLKEAGEREGSLLPSVRRFAARFTQATGINVEIKAETDLRINDRLAAEAFQMVAEGLSNVRRHTHARRASIALSRSDERLTLRIQNEGASGATPAGFTPRSITDRAQALGGQATVEQHHNGDTVIVIEIPL